MDVKLNKRLSTCLNYIKDFNVLYDVGTDHAYLPIQAVFNNHVQKAYAVDNKPGPLDRAKAHIENARISHAIEPILSDGLHDLRDDVDVINITGLGGRTIYDIVHNQPLKNVKRLVLQPNVFAEQVRMLCEENLKIVAETIVLEDGVYYPIIVLEKGEQTLTNKERLFGPFLLKQKHPYLKIMLKSELTHLNNILNKIPDGVDKSVHTTRKTLIEAVLYEDFRD